MLDSRVEAGLPWTTLRQVVTGLVGTLSPII